MIHVRYSLKLNLLMMKKNSYTNIYDKRWNVQPVWLNGKSNTPAEMPEPEKFDEAILVAESLNTGLDYCRVDLYLTSTRVYFSEFTFAPNNGREKFSPTAWDVIFGQNWNLTR